LVAYTRRLHIYDLRGTRCGVYTGSPSGANQSYRCPPARVMYSRAGRTLV